jgi:putative heme transporter
MAPARRDDGPSAEPSWRERSLVGPRYVLAGADAVRFLAMFAVVAVLVWLVVQIRVVSIGVLLAVLLTALHRPLFDLLRRARLPRAIAAALSLVLGLTVVGALGWFVFDQLANDLANVVDDFRAALERLSAWLQKSPLPLGSLDLSQLTSGVASAVEDNQAEVAAGALAAITSLSHLAAGLAIAVFCWFFFLYDGEGIWSWVTGRLIPSHHQEAIDGAARYGWTNLVGFMRGLVIVAAFDAVLIGLGLVLLGVPLALPLSVLVFLGAFVPVVGATISGMLAALVALTDGGLPLALAVVGLVLLVQQIEGNVLQPVVVGKLTSVHPVGIVLAVTVGALIAGAAGALFAVPLVAFVNAFANHLAGRVEPVEPGEPAGEAAGA